MANGSFRPVQLGDEPAVTERGIVVSERSCSFRSEFDCPCGVTEIEIETEDEGDEVTCPGCGRTYRLRVEIEVREPEPACGSS